MTLDASVFTSNGLPVASTAARFGRLREAPTQQHWRAQYLADGYLLLRGAVDPALVLKARTAYLAGFDKGFEGLPVHGTAGHPAHSFVRSKDFSALADNPVFAEIAATLLGTPTVRVPRTPLRHFIKGTHRASRAHTDRTYLDEPVENCVTLWVPLGDCAMDAGALMYLEGSHLEADIENRLRDNAPTDRAQDTRPISHDLAWVAERADSRWLTADFKAGDIVAHVPTIIHASLDPATDYMRVSTDLRFLRAGTAIDARWQNPWAADDGH
jgi:ectoine hydroxylase-related dioxygenase (phytanoyl-CoA dioxygenase family)